ncbi:hypothetical protein PGB90_006103 [Kerria lacca]
MKIDELSLDIAYLREQGYDGAAAMSGKFKGVQAIIRQIAPSDLYVHCANHCLNLALCKSPELASIRNASGTIEAAYNFFNTPKRQLCLEQYVDETLTEKHKLKMLNPTRWIERHTSVSTFFDLQLYIIQALDEISNWEDGNTASSATRLLRAIKTCEFNTSLAILNQILSYTLSLSQYLQSQNLDLIAAMKYAEEVVEVLKSLCQSADQNFSILWKEIERNAEKLDFELAISRVCGKQTKRSNAGAGDADMTVEKYFRINIFIPFLDSVLSQI